MTPPDLPLPLPPEEGRGEGPRPDQPTHITPVNTSPPGLTRGPIAPPAPLSISQTAASNPIDPTPTSTPTHPK